MPRSWLYGLFSPDQNAPLPAFRCDEGGVREKRSPICFHSILSVLVCMFAAQFLRAQTSMLRNLVNKNVGIGGQPPTITFLPLPVDIATRSGFTVLADYASQTLYEGPAAHAVQFQKDVVAQGFELDKVTDLNFVSFHGHQIDPDTGAATPPFPTAAVPAAAVTESGPSDGLFLLVLKGFPLDSWISDLAANNIRLVEGLPPVAYVVRGPTSNVQSLPAQTVYVRGVFPIGSNMKTLPFPPPPPIRHSVPSAFRQSRKRHQTRF